MAMGEQTDGLFEVSYEVPGRGQVVEATVTKCKNGLAVNYKEPYMRRRDPNAWLWAIRSPPIRHPMRNALVNLSHRSGPRLLNG